MERKIWFSEVALLQNWKTSAISPTTPPSSTKEKINVLSKYYERHLKTLILQDGNNSVLKSNKTDELFADYVELVENSVDKFSPENVVLCEIIPLKYPP